MSAQESASDLSAEEMADLEEMVISSKFDLDDEM
jgi:hypothetical protein